MKTSTLILTLSLIFGGAVFASPDHDHGAATFQPTKGGTIQSTHHHHFEMVMKENKIYLYVYNKEAKMLPTKGLGVTAKYDNPKAKIKKGDLTLVDKGDSWEAEVDWKGSHRVTIYVYIGEGKEKDYVKYTFSKN